MLDNKTEKIEPLKKRFNKYLLNTIEQLYREGVKDEEFVAKMIEESLGGSCEKASRYEDGYKHIDIWWNSPKGDRLGIDVKGLKRNTRSDKEYDDSIHWIEFINKSGNKGWLYGDADYIAFRTNTKILFLKREKLQNVMEERIDGKETVYQCPKEYYVPYQRRAWKGYDKIIKVPTKDLEEIMQFSINLT